MTIYKYFNPPPPDQLPPAPKGRNPITGDRRDGLGYVYTDDIILRVNVAFATGRPLLVSGPSGSGKSTLALSIARFLGWRMYEFVTTSATRARDIEYYVDTLRRLSDATRGGMRETELTRELHAQYVEPRHLWWALEPDSAKQRGLDRVPSDKWLKDTLNKNEVAGSDTPAVVLIDEIDKADPDVPNDLLVPLGSFEFHVEEVGRTVAPLKNIKNVTLPLIVITTNGERELPTAFLRRCLTLELERATPERLVQIAALRYGNRHSALYRRLAEWTDVRPDDKLFAAAPRPSTAEYLDAVRVCIELNLKPDRSKDAWKQIEAATFWKARANTPTA